MKKNILIAYEKKPKKYFNGVRHDIIEYLKDEKSLSIFEIGCGSGDTGNIAIEKGIAHTYDAIELNQSAANIAKCKLSNVFCHDVEEFSFNTMNKKYDCIIISEVLEHLNDPWSLLKSITPILKKDSIIFASSPNIASYKVILKLLSGKFEYTESGVMDRTHLRWFTPASFEQMFIDSGFKTIRIGPIANMGKKASIINFLTMKKWQYLLHKQVMYIGQYSFEKIT